MDINSIKTSLNAFIGQYYTQFQRLSRSESQLLEIGALMMTAEHYKRRGFLVRPENKIRNRFKLKVTARGKPFNFSWYSASKDGVKVEIHGNLSVRGAYGKDEGVYVVDVGVVVADTLPTSPKEKKQWRAMANCNLVTFVEAKKLVIYPMLMAQFIGIVHEIKPAVMKRKLAWNDLHFYPALVSVGHLHGISRGIREGFRRRKFRVNVIPAFDIEVSRLAGNAKADSPFEPLQVVTLPAQSANVSAPQTQPVASP
jgi:hypothetical protein